MTIEPPSEWSDCLDAGCGTCDACRALEVVTRPSWHEFVPCLSTTPRCAICGKKPSEHPLRPNENDPQPRIGYPGPDGGGAGITGLGAASNDLGERLSWGGIAAMKARQEPADGDPSPLCTCDHDKSWHEDFREKAAQPCLRCTCVGFSLQRGAS